MEGAVVIFGITGRMGSGKTTLACGLQRCWATPLQIFEVDALRRHALWSSESRHHVQLRQQLAAAFRLPTETDKCWMERERFTQLIFSTRELFEQCRTIVTPVLQLDLRSSVPSGHDSVIVWAYLVEEEYDRLLDGPVLILDCDDATVQQRMATADLGPDQWARRSCYEPTLAQRLDLCVREGIPHQLIAPSDTPQKIRDEYLRS